jgi:hypothetical protein
VEERLARASQSYLLGLVTAFERRLRAAAPSGPPPTATAP